MSRGPFPCRPRKQGARCAHFDCADERGRPPPDVPGVTVVDRWPWEPVPEAGRTADDDLLAAARALLNKGDNDA